MHIICNSCYFVLHYIWCLKLEGKEGDNVREVEKKRGSCLCRL